MKTKQPVNLGLPASWLATWAVMVFSAAQALSATWDVTIQNFAFVPSALTIQVGDTVRWTQKDSTTHTTTSGPNGVADGLWNSGNMTRTVNNVFSFTFTKPGNYPYFCEPHRSFMRAAITVNAAAQGPAVILSTPADGATFIAPATIILSASASPGSNPIAMVHFFSNDTQVAEVMAPPYTVNLSDLPVGRYTFTAQALDSGGLSSISAPVSVTVEAPTSATMTGMEVVGSLGAQFAWTGGTPPYLIQKTTGLSDSSWTDVATTEDASTIVARDSSASFYRVVSHTEKTVMPFTVWLNGDSERPKPVITPAGGFGTITISGNAMVVNVSYSGLTAAATGAHVHGVATTSQSAAVIIPLTVAASTAGTITGTYDLSGLTTEQRDALLHGHTYMNIHTGNNPSGEIRGQVAPVLWDTTLSGAAERPTPVTTAATGYGDFWLIGNEITYDVDYSDLPTPAQAAHLHGPATAEDAAGVLQALDAEDNELGTTGAFSGTLTLNPDQLSYVVDGLTYVNVHTSANPNGEVRGQVAP